MLTNTAIIARIRDVANRIPEPCGLAQGMTIGMVDMGLIREIDVLANGPKWDITVHARVTSPDCLHVVYFERELRAMMQQIPEIGLVEILWDACSDWTPECMSESLRTRMKERRAKLTAQK